MQCLFLVLLYKKFMKIFQRSCANRFVFVSECKSRTRFYSDKGFAGKIFKKIDFCGNFGGIILGIDSCKLQILGVKLERRGERKGSYTATVSRRRGRGEKGGGLKKEGAEMLGKAATASQRTERGEQ